MLLKPVTTEKAVRMIDVDNILLFEVERRAKKTEIKKEVADTFNIKIDGVRTLIRGNKKYVYVKLNKSNLAIDVATKLGMI
jgi:large subunit ribosomal protein L23